MCGADAFEAGTLSTPWGLPPRVRSRRSQTTNRQQLTRITSACAEQTIGSVCNLGIRGITSACAEQTIGLCEFNRIFEDYLRVCGADATCNRSACLHVGLPPRVRSRRQHHRRESQTIRITSACAEQTVVFYCVLSQLNGVEYLIYALRRVS